MKRKSLIGIGIGMGVAGVSLGLVAAQAQGAAVPGGQARAAALAETTQDSPYRENSREPALTESDAEKATALAAVPGGTIIWVDTDHRRDYEALVQKADGMRVAVDEDFTGTAASASDIGREGDGGDSGQAGSASEADPAAGIRHLEGYGQQPVLHGPETRALTEPGTKVESP